MREILFRGKRTDNGEWVEGYYCRTFRWSGDMKPVLGIQEADGFMFRMVIPETVGQWTGLKDKNGKLIFDGDILRCSSLHENIVFIAVVEFGNPNGEYNWGWQLKPILGDKANTDILLWCETELDGVYAEVIGNIHDNPRIIGGAS